MKRVFGSFLLLIMLFHTCFYCEVPVIRAAAIIDSGTCGESITWELDDEGTLTIQGRGKMDEAAYGVTEWQDHHAEIKNLVVQEGITEIGLGSFMSLYELQTVTLPESLEVIGAGAFRYCSKLSHIDLPEGLKTIDRGAFGDCTILEEIEIPDSVSFVGEEAFTSCFYLTKAKLPEGITTISGSCFEGCSRLKEVNIPSTVKTIGQSAFASCFELDAVELPEGLEKIEQWAFSNAGIQAIEFPDSLTTIEEFAFSGSKLLTVAIPETVSEVGRGVFSNASLVSVTLPRNMTVLPRDFFNGTGIVRMYIPDGISTIESYAFRLCTNLASVRIPLSVTKIEDAAFWTCWGLKDVFYEGSKEDWEKITIEYNNTDLTDATIHYNCIGAIDDPESLKPIVFHVGRADEGKQDIELNIKWDNELFLLDSEQYHSELAIPCLILSGAVELDDASKRVSAMLETFGFSKEHLFFGYFNTKYNYLEPAAAFGHTTIELDGKNKELFIIVARGTSNGSDVLTDISSVVGGFSVAADHMKTRFMEYVEKEMGVSYEEVVSNSEDNILLITGHSLGGAIANHLSRDLIDFAPKKQSFIYTFAAPQSFPLVDRENRFTMSNVFNVINTDDIVPFQPPVGYYRIGENRYFSSNHNTNIQNTFKLLTLGRSYANSFAEFPFGWFLTCHAIETYMSFLINDDEKWIDIHPIRIVRIECPVDIEVYNAKGEIVGKITDNAIDPAIQTKVGLSVDGDKKYIYLMEDEEYSFVITGTDAGTMNCIIDTIDIEKDECINETGYYDVQIDNGKAFKGEFGSLSDQDLHLYTMDEQQNIIAEVTEKGDEISIEPTIEPQESNEEESIVEEHERSEESESVTEESDSSFEEPAAEEESQSLWFDTSSRRPLLYWGIAFGLILVLGSIVMIILKKRK